MNTRHPLTQDDFAHDVPEHEWQLQERALREARAQEHGDHALAAYRRIDRALRQPPDARLPSNFAYQVAALAARLPRATGLDLRLERWLLRGLAAAMALGALVAGFAFGDALLAVGDALIASGNGSHGARWIALVGACILLSWGMHGLRALQRR
jgi:hypothetical protein